VALARCPRCERVVDAEGRPIRELAEADLKKTVAYVPCKECVEGDRPTPVSLTPGEQLLDAGYRQCFFCGRLMLRDGVPMRRMTEEEQDTFQPCAPAPFEACTECAVADPLHQLLNRPPRTDA
jgi:hypothetical protein